MGITLAVIICVFLGVIIIVFPEQEADVSKDMREKIKRHGQYERELDGEQEERRNWKRKFWNGYNSDSDKR